MGADTPDKLKEYLGHFAINAVGLTGEMDELKAVAGQYGGFFEKNDSGSEAGYAVDHSTFTMLVDRKGKVRYLFRYEDSQEVHGEIFQRGLPVGELFLCVRRLPDSPAIVIESTMHLFRKTDPRFIPPAKTDRWEYGRRKRTTVRPKNWSICRCGLTNPG